VVSVLDSGAEGPGFKSQPRRCRVTVLGKLFTPTVPLFTKQHSETANNYTTLELELPHDCVRGIVRGPIYKIS